MRNPDWSTLNAYVDGELDADAAASVAAAAGEDAEVAGQIALLYQLKGVTHAAVPDAPPGLANLLPKRRKIWPAAMAAAAVLLLVVGTALWLSLSATPAATLPPQLLATARTLHTQWLKADAGKSGDAAPTVVLAALSRFGQVPVVPDLDSTELAIALVTVSNSPAGRILQIGYRGNHGCHLSLFVFAHGGLPKSPVRVAIGNARAYGWRVDDLGYLLFAKGMDETRLTLIADKVEQATRDHAPLDSLARQQLAENKRNSASCHA